ncbi:hypothetical protein LTR72_010029 [Exophiala xenobiotica]|nr:hypothetical protein LTR72_010029 [Exophiala xenobiotica]KAK5287696.1 hypothetical protein LTR14_008927 [Exophiala xenobiotica]KAK5475561.1 hypothetical protein LTR55_009190 [Exophiala xenobiotica]
MPNSAPLSVPSPKRSFSSISSPNPRRTHPSQSKSLPKSKRVKLEHNSDGSGSGESALQAAGCKVAAGESRDSSSDQSAAKWFDRVNRNVESSRNKVYKHEDESPFFMAQQESYHQSGPLQSLAGETFGQRAQDDNERHELRGVIDDLTIENKRLKTLLRDRQSRPGSSSSDPDRIIEVRLHGLPAEKKRELEQLLQTFAHGLNGASPTQHGSYVPVDKSLPSPGTSLLAGQKHEHTHTDSGYVSVSNSGLNSSSGTAMSREPVSKRKKDKDIKNYLHDIPDALFPQNTMSISDSAKMVLVVQRLEQLYTGKTAHSGDHSLPVQQQKISRDAAKADRAEDRRQNRTVKVEGSREAPVLPPDSKINFDAMEQGRQTAPYTPSDKEASSSSGTPGSLERPVSPNQRPTRPLDLDIHRAQIAEDNLKYIQHLGLSSSEYSPTSNGEQQPWIYLNLLISMAQLHTLNVTPAFVRKAIRQLSTQFELSKDGHKVRWNGDASQGFSPNFGISPGSVSRRITDDTPDEGGRQSGSATSNLNEQRSMSMSDDKRMGGKPSTTTSKLVESTLTLSNPAIKQPSSMFKSSTFDYKPIVFKGKKKALKASNSYLDSSSSHEGLSPDSDSLTHALSRSSLRSKDDAPDGLITFYSNPYFCTDLSGDRSPINMRSLDSEQGREVLGLAKEQQPEDEIMRDVNACYFTARVDGHLSSWPAICPPVKMDFAPVNSAGEDETQPIELEASGIGGIRPEDNFALDVKVARSRLRDGERKAQGKGKGKGRRGEHAKYSYRTEECTKLSLQPSRLPPPSYVLFATSSSSSAGEGHFYEDSESESSDHNDPPAPAGLLWQWSSSSNDRQIPDDNSEASSSFGVLEAARARLRDPQTISPQDRDFIDPSGRTMSGSLAATVGASWSAKSIVEPEAGPEDGGDLSSDMSVDEDYHRDDWD